MLLHLTLLWEGQRQIRRKWRHHGAHLKATSGSRQAEQKQPVLCGKRNLKVIRFGSQLIDFCAVSVTRSVHCPVPAACNTQTFCCEADMVSTIENTDVKQVRFTRGKLFGTLS